MLWRCHTDGGAGTPLVSPVAAVRYLVLAASLFHVYAHIAHTHNSLIAAWL